MNPVLSILFVLHFLNDGVRAAFTSMLPFIAHDLHLSFTQVGFLGASQGALVTLLALPAGFLSLRFGGFKLLFFSLLAYSLGALAIGFAPNVLVLMIIFYLAVGGFGMFHAVGNVLVVRNSSHNQIGRNMGNYTINGDLGRMILPVAAIFLASFLGWRNAFFIVAGCGLATYLFTKFWTPLKGHLEKEQQKTHTISLKEWLAELPHLFKKKKLLLVMLAGLFDNIGANPIFIFLPFFILSRGFGAEMLGVFTAAYFIGSLSGKWFLSRRSDKFGSARVFIFAEVLMAVTLIILIFSAQFFVLLILAYFLGLFARGTTPLISTMFSEVIHEKHYEKAYAVGELVFGLSVVIAPIAMGVVADKVGIVAVFYLAAIFALLAVIPILFLAKAGTIKEEKNYVVNEANV